MEQISPARTRNRHSFMATCRKMKMSMLSSRNGGSTRFMLDTVSNSKFRISFGISGSLPVLLTRIVMRSQGPAQSHRRGPSSCALRLIRPPALGLPASYLFRPTCQHRHGSELTRASSEKSLQIFILSREEAHKTKRAPGGPTRCQTKKRLISFWHLGQGNQRCQHRS
jgi:hypothetical protein